MITHNEEKWKVPIANQNNVEIFERIQQMTLELDGHGETNIP